MVKIPISYCKQCGQINTNGTSFCSRKCRVAWKLKHEIKGAKKREAKRQELVLMSMGSDFNNETDRQNSN
jgi:hypothetical protein